MGLRQTLFPDDIVQWAAERWNVEVKNRPLQNVHRRALDTAWRQVIRRYGGDDVILCGPAHDDLIAPTTKERPRDPKAEPDDQLNEFCREPPCVSSMCRRERRCLYT